MHRIDTPSRQKDKFGAGKDGFTQGDPQTGTQATQVSANFLDSLQEEIAAVIEDPDSGAALDKGKSNQLVTAIKAIIRSAGMLASESVRGVVKFASQTQTNAGTDDDVAVTPKKLRAGFSISLAVNGYIALPTWMGGLIWQWGATQVQASTINTYSYPIAFPNAALVTLAGFQIPASGSLNAMPLSPSQFRLQNTYAGIQNGYWLAFGY